jgi:hypothetical protein
VSNDELDAERERIRQIIGELRQQLDLRAESQSPAAGSEAAESDRSPLSPPKAHLMPDRRAGERQKRPR